MNVHYSSRLFSRAAADLQGDKLVIISPTAEIPRGAVAFAVEGDRWLVTLFEYGGETPPTGLAEFRASRAHSLRTTSANWLRARLPWTTGPMFFVPTACLRRFDKLRALPDGYLCLGDSLCQLNPCYGQGITSAVLQADALEKALAGGRTRCHVATTGSPSRLHRSRSISRGPPTSICRVSSRRPAPRPH